MMIPPVKTFQLYMAVKLHFTQKSYDVLKQRGHVKNTSQVDLDKRNDKGLFYNFSKLAETPKEMASILVANFAYGNVYPVEDVEKAKSLYHQWRRNRESISYIFRKDLSTIANANVDWFTLLLNRKITIETVCIMQALDTEDILNEIPTAWSTWRLKIMKLTPFVKFDKDKLTPIYQSFKEQRIKHGT